MSKTDPADQIGYSDCLSFLGFTVRVVSCFSVQDSWKTVSPPVYRGQSGIKSARVKVVEMPVGSGVDQGGSSVDDVSFAKRI